MSVDPRPLTEKTVELNVTANILEDIRHIDPHAFAYGYSLIHESRLGLDTSIDPNIPGNTKLLSLQFKRAYRRDGDSYSFHINNNKAKNQHNLVWMAAIRAGGRGRFSVFYALPCFASAQGLASQSPWLLDDTEFVDPFDVGLLNDGKQHELRVNHRLHRFTRHSEGAHPTRPTYTWSELSEGIRRERFGVTVREFRSSLSEPSEKEKNVELRLEHGRTKVGMRAYLWGSQLTPNSD